MKQQDVDDGRNVKPVKGLKPSEDPPCPFVLFYFNI